MSPPKPGPAAPFAANLNTLLAKATQLRQSRRFLAAIEPMRQAAKLQPGNPFVQHDLGLTCLEAGRFDDALAPLTRAIEIRPEFAEAHWRLGVALEQNGDPERARAALSRALELNPALLDAGFRLASLLEAIGQQTRAAAQFTQVAAMAPPGEWRDLAHIRSLLLKARDAEAEAALRQAADAYPHNTALQSRLGQVLSEAGDFEGAEAAFGRAIAAAPGAVDLYYDLVRCRRITPQDTALIEAMQSAATRPHAKPEAPIKLHLALGKAFDDLGQYEQAMAAFDAADTLRRRGLDFDLETFNRTVDWTIEHFSASRLDHLKGQGDPDPTPVLIVGMPRSGTTLCEQILSSHPRVGGGGEMHFWDRRAKLMKAADPSMPTDHAAQGRDYVAFLRQVDETAERVIDKMPFNFLWLGLIHAALPAATIIHCRRDPLDTALSVHQTFFSLQRDFPTGGADLVGYHRAYERLMAHWRSVLPTDRLLDVDYESLVADPEPETRRIVAHTGLEWDERCLSPQTNDRRVKTASKWQARQPVYKTAVARWRNYAPFLGSLMELSRPEET